MDQIERLQIDLPADLAAYVHARTAQDAHATDSDVLIKAVRDHVAAVLVEGGTRTGAQVAASAAGHAARWRYVGG